MSDLSTSCPHVLMPLGVMVGSKSEESALHKRFSKYRVKGEWFHPSPAVLEFVAGLDEFPPDLSRKSKPPKKPKRKKKKLMKKPQPRKQRRITSAKIDPTKPASIVIQKFGGLSRFCEMTGFATSTAHGWMISGHIQAHRKGVSIHAQILAIAAANGIKIKPSDFVELPPAQSAPAADALAANG